jgi:hypothetical protein
MVQPGNKWPTSTTTSAAIPTIAEVVDGFFFCARST